MRRLFLAVILLSFVPLPAPATLVSVDPDAAAIGTDLNTVFSDVAFSVVGRPTATVVSADGFSVFNGRNLATTGSLVFGYVPPVGPIFNGKFWNELEYGTLRIDFLGFTTKSAKIDILFTDDDLGFLSAFDTAGNLLASVERFGDGRNLADPFFRASITRPTADIAFITAGGRFAEGLFLDNFQYASVPEPSTLVLLGIGLAGLGMMGRKKKTNH